MKLGGNNLRNSPALWVSTAYFAMGLPFIVIAQTSSLMYKDLGISDTQIAFWTSLITLPWTLKPLWSPILEMFKTKKYFVVGTQLLTGFSFALVAFTLQLSDFFQYSLAFLLIIAFSGATHDVATDGVYLSVLSKKMQAMYIGWQGASYNVAKIISGGLLVYIAGELSRRYSVQTAWMSVMGLYSIIMILLGLYHIRMLPSGGRSKDLKNLKEGFSTFFEVLRSFFLKKYIAWYILFIILYRFAEGFAIKIAPLFLKATTTEGGLGLDTTQIGIITGVFGSASFVIGSIVGGYLISIIGLKKILFRLALIFNIPFAVYFLLALYQPESLEVITIAIAFEYFGYGAGFVGLTLFMMQQVATGKHKMAHYAFASGIMNLGVLLPSMVSGKISDWQGYKVFFLWVLIATIPSLLVAKFVPFIHSDKEEDG